MPKHFRHCSLCGILHPEPANLCRMCLTIREVELVAIIRDIRDRSDARKGGSPNA